VPVSQLDLEKSIHLFLQIRSTTNESRILQEILHERLYPDEPRQGASRAYGVCQCHANNKTLL